MHRFDLGLTEKGAFTIAYVIVKTLNIMLDLEVPLTRKKGFQQLDKKLDEKELNLEITTIFVEFLKTLVFWRKRNEWIDYNFGQIFR